MDILKKIIETDGIDLSDVGINGYAFKAYTALKAVELLRECSIKILGGDVFSCTAGEYELTYDNWYYEGSDVDKSCDKARDYIKNYHARNGDNFIYQIII